MYLAIGGGLASAADVGADGRIADADFRRGLAGVEHSSWLACTPTTSGRRKPSTLLKRL